jgi:hypothetical protein
MDIYLQKFKALPKELQEAVSSEEKIKALDEIEKKYNLKLVKLVIRLMIKDILWDDLEKFLEENFKLTNEKAIELKKELSEKIFNEVMGYLKEIPKTEEMPSLTKITQQKDEIIEEIKKKFGLVFEDEILEKRFNNIIESYFKEIRNEIQTEEMLSRSKKIGGLELPKEKVDGIMKMIKEIKKNLDSSFIQEKKTEGGTILSSFKELKEAIEETVDYELKKVKKEEKKDEIPVQIKKPISDEKIVEDISFKPKAVGPIEELKGIDLTDLRRWGKDQTMEIIFEKINLLAEESIFKKAEAISAWRSSPLFNLYLEIGQEAIKKKKNLNEIIEERKRQNLPTLEIDEFEAIVNLNRKIRF